MASRARDREPFVVEQPLDHEHSLDVLTPIQPVPLRALDRLQRWELRLPIPQNELLGAGQAADLADPEKILCRKG